MSVKILASEITTSLAMVIHSRPTRYAIAHCSKRVADSGEADARAYNYGISWDHTIARAKMFCSRKWAMNKRDWNWWAWLTVQYEHLLQPTDHQLLYK